MIESRPISAVNERSPGAAAIALRGFILLGLVLALGPPINDSIRFFVLVVAGFLVLTLPLKRARWRYAAAAVAVAVAFWLPTFLPRAAIEEGHNVFIYPNHPTVLERELPPPVFAVMRDQFLEQYSSRDCGGSKRCWLNLKMPDELFAFSVEGLARSPKYSRVVDRIGFDGLADFRGGFVNDLGYDWRSEPGEPDRNTMPFFVMYELPADVIGGELCWRGHVLWETADGGFEHLPQSDYGCRRIDSGDAGGRVFGVSILTAAPLAMGLELPQSYKAANLATTVLGLIAVLGVVLLCVAVPAGRAEISDRLRRQAILLVVTLAIMGVYVMTRTHDFIFTGNPPIKHLLDGLFFAEYARSILIGFVNGDVMEMLRGGQDVFVKMPFLPYIRAFGHAVFGDTNYQSTTVLLLLPFAVWTMAATMVSRRWAWWFAVSFVVLPVLGHLGLWYYNYLHLGADMGHAEPIATALFFAALALVIRHLPAEKGGYVLYGLGACLMFAVAVLCRPNYGPGAAAVIAVVTWRLWRQQRLIEAVIAAAGFLPIFFMLWHNLTFGGVFVLAAASADAGETLQAPPSVYVAAAREVLSLDFDGRGLRSVSRQWQRWLSGGIYLPLLLWLIYALARGRLSADARLIAYAALAQHGVLLFWNAKGRFTYIAWALTIFALLPYFERATGWIAGRWRARRSPPAGAMGLPEE